MKTRKMLMMGAALAVMGAFGWSSPAAALVETEYCDTSSSDCDCPSMPSGHSSCDSIDPANLVSPDSPGALNSAANIQTTYDSKADVYYVEVDTSGFNAGGILPVHSNNGHWNSVLHLHEYLEVLLGTTIDSAALANNNQLWPNMVVSQRGTIAKIDLSTGKWSTYNHNNLVLDAISDNYGDITIGDETTNAMSSIGNVTCSTNSLAYDSHLTGFAGFFGEQCSVQEDTTYSFPYSEEQTVSFLVRWVKTVFGGFELGTINDVQLSYDVGQVYMCIGTNNFSECLFGTNPPELVTYKGVLIDNGQLDNDVYTSGNKNILLSGSESMLDFSDNFSFTSFGGTGICSHGDATEGSFQIDLYTLEGSVDLGDEICGQV